MKKMTSGELRSMWLSFFKSKGHAVIPSASVIPENDPTVLFTTAGMHPLVPYLLGSKHPAGTRQGILLPLHGGRQLLGGHDPLLHAAAVGDLHVDEDLGIGRADGGQLAGLLPGPGQDL